MIYTPAAFLLLLTVSSSIASAALGRGHGAFLRRQAQDSDCRCGYSKDGVIFPKRFSIDFTSAQTPEAITAAGMYVTDSFDWQVGEVAPDGTTAYGQASNVRPAGADGIALVVPGGQAGKQQVTCGEIAFQNGGQGMSRIHTEVEMQVSSTPGTCQSIFTFVAAPQSGKDEMDIEILGASLMSKSEVAEAGVQLTNHAPDLGNDERDHKIVPFSVDPSIGFHKFAITWTGAGGEVSYAMDGAKLDSPSGLVGVRDSHVILNHWSTSDVAFMGAPMPEQDVSMKVRNLVVYYAEPGVGTELAEGCQESDVCAV